MVSKFAEEDVRLPAREIYKFLLSKESGKRTYS